MELLEGGPVMNKNLEDGPLPLPTARKYFIDVVRGLEYRTHLHTSHATFHTPRHATHTTHTHYKV
jgi:hypothetical protein